MAKSQLNLPPTEVKRVDRQDSPTASVVRKPDRDEISPLDAAKSSVGGCVKFAMEGRAMKEFGDSGLMSNVCSGDKVPDYLARIWMDRNARRRFGLAFLRGDVGVKVTTTVSWDDNEGAA